MDYFSSNLVELLSFSRLQSYSTLCPSKVNEEIIGAYHWNLAISKQLYPYIHTSEITLINSIHHALAHYFSDEFWFDKVVVPGKSKDTLQTVKNDLAKKLSVVSANDIVASLTFGFWVGLLKQKVYANPYYAFKLWPHLLNVVFPHFTQSKADDIVVIANQFDRVRLIRNRIFHHEPVWKFTPTDTPAQCIKKLNKVAKHILKAIGWISLEKKMLLTHFNFVQDFKETATLETLERYKQLGVSFFNEASIKND